jgi:hypothetical protein
MRLASAQGMGKSAGRRDRMDTNALNSFSQSPGLVAGLSSGTLFASMFWGAVGCGFFVYAKKQKSIPALLGGVGLIGISYFIGSPLWMSVAAVGIIAGVWFLSRDD